MFEFKFNNNIYKSVYFVGIGGISMSGLAEILKSKGYQVQGSDAKESETTKHLEKLGIKVYIGHSEDNVKGVDLVIYTDAVSQDNPELRAAKNLNIDTIDRASFLGALMMNYEKSIAVSGTHGKTTTTSMIASITNHTENFNPTILLGGNLNEIGGNIRLASDKCIITEACEYKGNILKYFPTTAIILNIDEDHLDYFKNIQHIIDTFKSYTDNIQKNGNLIINKDDNYTEEVLNYAREDIKVHSFSIDKDSDYTAKNIKFLNNSTSFDLVVKNGKSYPVLLNTIGKHNIYNALASIIAIHLHGISFEEAIDYIKLYSGVQRRLELKGQSNGVIFLDDYAHHPTEIKTTLEALKNSSKTEGTTYCVFQPHTFTRTQILLDSFSKAFKDVDQVIITDIFAAREIDNGKIHSKDLAKAVNKISNNAKYLGSFEEVQSFLKNNLKENDIVITMGAGNVHQIGEAILKDKINIKKPVVV